ncbi:hypothetical protein [Marinobacter algicola]|uniref:hypothetical protein n=1 Tax=Marinobacter algicola TaxID=236100 RepID=UPI0012F482BA|nr:hypothetical protein [Marinobacter algicola]
MITEILAVFGGVTVVVVGLSRWLGGLWSKRILQNERASIERELEREKSRLQESLEVTKAALASQTKLVEERLNAINDERFKALIENYSLLADTWLNCRWAIQPDEIGRDKPPETERLKIAAESIDEYFKDFERKKLFLSDDSQSSVYTFITSVWESLNKLRIFSESSESIDDKLNALYGAWVNDLKPKMDAARRSIESEYKMLIGVDEHNQALQRTSR